MRSTPSLTLSGTVRLASALIGLLLMAEAVAAASPAVAAAAPSGAVASAAPTVEAGLSTFTNPIYRGQDPSVVLHEGNYYLCQSRGGRIEVYKSATLAERGRPAVVWRAPRTGWNSAMVWAPELQRIRGRWYIYYAAAARPNDNASHRMGVLRALTDDPQGPYEDAGMLYTGDDPGLRRDNRWAIDGMVLDHRGKLYLCWSGWEDDRDVQYLYLARMKSPTEIATPRVKLCANDTYRWERVGEDPRQRGLHEGPAFLVRHGRVFLIYSASGSWQATYKMGMLYADEKADLMNPRSWKKHPRPVFESAGEVFGLGHCCFTTSPDGRQDFVIFHSKTSRREGWDRVVRAQPFRWTEDGLPDFGRPLPDDVPIPLPAAAPSRAVAAPKEPSR